MRVHLRTFGCRANHYDTESVRALVEAAGHTVVDGAAEADVAVFNSCAVTAAAEADLRQAVRRAARERPGLRSVVMGCAPGASASGESRLRTLPGVEAVIPGADLVAVARALALPPTIPLRRAARQTSSRALLRIQDGCDEHCTFCATTIARGAQRSRPPAELAQEAEELADAHPEIVITGIHIGTYGADIDTSLGELMELLVRRVPRVRFRLSSLEATEVDGRLFELLTGAPAHVAPHLHAPLQSGSDRVLRRMGRHWYTARSYASAVERLRDVMPVLGLGADLIPGFPGETEDDHQQSLALVEALPFTYLHVFPFSPRPGTAAERLPGRVPPDVALRRARELRHRAEQKAKAYVASRAGQLADCVVVRRGGPGVGEALTEDYLTVLPGDATLPRRTRYRARLFAADDVRSLTARPLEVLETGSMADATV